MADETIFEVAITAADQAGGTTTKHIEYKTRLSDVADVPSEITAELGKALGKDAVREVSDDR